MSSPFSVLAQIAEQRIVEAQKNGEFDNLPGQGKPCDIEDLSGVPEELRMAYKLLKNANCLPPEIEDRKQAANLIELLDNCEDERQKLVTMQKLRLLINRHDAGNQRHCLLTQNDTYYQKILSRLESHERNQRKKS